MGAACMLSSGQGCTCLLTNWVNNSVSPPVQTRWPTCLCAQSHVAMSAQTNTTRLCTRPGNHGNVRASSTFLFQEAGQSPSRRLAQHQTPYLGNWKGIVLGQMDMPKLTAPQCRSLVLPCLLTMAICCIGYNSEPVHPATVLWHGYKQAPGSTMGMEWHRAGRLAPACSEALPAMRLCKRWDNEPGLTLCHCALLQPWAEPITPCSSPWELRSRG